MEQMKVESEVTEELKEVGLMKWIELINNVKSVTEETVLKEIIFV